MDRQWPHGQPPNGTSFQRPGAHTASNTMPSFAPPAPPPTTQPPVQIPFSDPFHNRDPFLPGPQHRRKDSYGGAGGAPLTPLTGGERGWPLQPGPQPPPGLYPSQTHPNHYPNDQSRAPLSWDSARRRSLGGAASPPRYGGPLEPPPPPPPSFASRNMPPPSPSNSATPNYSTHGPRGPPSVPPFSHPYEQHMPASRQHGGMSIHDMLGGERPPQPPRSPKAMTTQNSPTFRSHNPPSPKRARSTSMRSDFRMHRPNSPNGGSHAPFRYEDERDRFYPPRQEYAPAHAPTPSSAPAFRQYQFSPRSEQFALQNGAQGLQRPNSQPIASAQQEQRAVWQDAHNEGRVLGAFREYHGPSPEQARPHSDEFRHGPGAFERSRFADSGPGHAPGHYGSQSHQDQHEYQGPPHFRPAEPSHTWDGRPPHEARPASGFGSSPASAERSGFESRFRHYPGPPPDRERDGRATPGTMHREEDRTPIPRSRLTVSPELNRKNGRASPLPQAVQGAQFQLRGPGRDPSIKNEFGRMFSGLGSGVGGSGTPNGPYSAAGNLTPSRLSPSRFADREASRSAEPENVVNGTSVLHRHDRQASADREDSEELYRRGTPSQLDGNKRIKTAHHHHHHGHAHHHHHHHHAAAEEASANKSGFSTLRFPPNGTATPELAAKPLHHHHHHHGNHVHAPHHHHHPATQVVAQPAPEIKVRNGDLVASMTETPKAHLGSALYSSHLSLPANKRSSLVDTKFLFSAAPVTIPKFEDGSGCTFTVRVPREYVQIGSTQDTGHRALAGGLEEICRRRAVWGTDIYTDDTDVVAAAVHAGWIRGSFGAELDKDIEDLFPVPEQSYAEEHAREQLTTKPDQPMIVPRGVDVHITIRILPALQKYTASTRNYIKSRSWGDDHDGMSYMVHTIDFVDEPKSSRFKARGLKVKKARVREELRRREAADSLLGLGRAAVGGVSVGA